MKIIACLLLLLTSVAASATTTVTVYTYHNHPPFVTGDDQGLTYDLVDRFNAIVGDEVQFEVQVIPRSRLNMLLAKWVSGECRETRCDDNWVVPWVNPKWGFGAEPRINFGWVRQLQDANQIVSRSEAPVDYSGPESLTGKVFGGIRGHRYVGIDDLAASGAIKRIDGNNERNNLLKLLMGRIDATLLPKSTVEYYMQQDEVITPQGSELYIAGTAHQQYWRYLMFPVARPDLQRVFEQFSISALTE